MEPRMNPSANRSSSVDSSENSVDEQGIELLRAMLKLTPAERAREAQRLWNWYRKLHPRKWAPFWRSFDSFEELEVWKSQQTDPELW